MNISAIFLTLGLNCITIQQDSTFEMKDILDSISMAMIEISDSSYSDIYIKSKWFGSPGVNENDIKKVESRLKVDLPKDYKDFLKISNGFHSFSTIDPTFLPIDRIDYLKNIDPELIEIWKGTGNDEVGMLIEKSIIIAGFCEEQYFLLIPPDTESNKWRYWKFASWIPGQHEFNDLNSYFRNTLDFLNDILKEKNKQPLKIGAQVVGRSSMSYRLNSLDSLDL